MAVVLFDGVCNLCNGLVRFVIERDPQGYFQFAPLTSPTASRLLRAAVVPSPLPDSVVLVEDGRVFTRSDAILRIARRLTFPWRLASALSVIPAGLRDRVYDAVARRRYGWFGRRQTCAVPSPAIRSRFLD